MKCPARGFDVPFCLKGRELAAVWAGVRRHQASGTTLAARRREELRLFPRLRKGGRASAARQPGPLGPSTQGSGPCQRGGAGCPRYTASGHSRAGGGDSHTARHLPSETPGRVGRDSAAGRVSTTPLTLPTVPDMPVPDHLRLQRRSTPGHAFTSPPYVAHPTPFASTPAHPLAQAGFVPRPSSALT